MNIERGKPVVTSGQRVCLEGSWREVFDGFRRVDIVYQKRVCNELGGYMARFTQFPIMITRSTIIYEIISPSAAGSSIYV